jgi:hypothetical protein
VAHPTAEAKTDQVPKSIGEYIVSKPEKIKQRKAKTECAYAYGNRPDACTLNSMKPRSEDNESRSYASAWREARFSFNRSSDRRPRTAGAVDLRKGFGINTRRIVHLHQQIGSVQELTNLVIIFVIGSIHPCVLADRAGGYFRVACRKISDWPQAVAVFRQIFDDG